MFYIELQKFKLSHPSEWNWINSKVNVADEATKLYKKFNFINESNWFKGSKILYGNLYKVVDDKEHKILNVVNHINSSE